MKPTGVSWQVGRKNGTSPTAYFIARESAERIPRSGQASSNGRLPPEQELYEQIRPLVLFHQTAGERAKEIDVPQRTLARKADEYEHSGMQSLFPSGEQGGARETGKTLPEDVRRLIVDLHAEMPTMSWREIAEVCYVQYGRRPDHKNVKRIATSGLRPS